MQRQGADGEGNGVGGGGVEGWGREEEESEGCHPKLGRRRALAIDKALEFHSAQLELQQRTSALQAARKRRFGGCKA